MACNLKVVSTRYGALPRVFSEGDGLYFSNGEADISKIVESAMVGDQINTRQKVLPFTWCRVIKQLEKIYDGLLKG